MSFSSFTHTHSQQERESRIETKRRDRNSSAFAFGSSTPRLLDVPADYGLVSPSTFWSQRRYVCCSIYNFLFISIIVNVLFRSTSISNVAGASLSRRSSERELADSGAKKRTSSSTDRHDGEFTAHTLAHHYHDTFYSGRTVHLIHLPTYTTQHTYPHSLRILTTYLFLQLILWFFLDNKCNCNLQQSQFLTLYIYMCYIVIYLYSICTPHNSQCNCELLQFPLPWLLSHFTFIII